MIYGYGSTVNPRDLINNPTILYVGIRGGMELLQFSYFSRNKGAIIAVDPINEMIDACATNLEEAEKLNFWFKKDFVILKMVMLWICLLKMNQLTLQLKIVCLTYLIHRTLKRR